MKVTPLGDDLLVVDGMEIPARCFRLEIDGRCIDLWYSAGSGEWLALETNAKGDRTIRYEPVQMVERLTGAEFPEVINET